MIGIDTNIFVYLFQTDVPAKTDQSRRIVSRCDPARVTTTGQVLGEFLNVVAKRRLLPVDAAGAAIAQFRQLTRIVWADDECLEDAFDAHRDHGISIWDALVWATVRAAGSTFLLSEDGQDGRTLGGVLFVNPYLEKNLPLVDRLFPASP